MKTSKRQLSISITILDNIQLNMREAAFLREMAHHCVKTAMAGHGACDKLIKILDNMQVPERTPGPIYGIFEEGT